MSSPTIEIHRPASGGRTRVDPRRGRLSNGRQSGPAAHPTHAVPAPSLPERRRPTAQACRLESTATGQMDWRLTDRGVAVIMVVGLMIVTAALSVVGLTALQVTGSDYLPFVHTTSGRG